MAERQQQNQPPSSSQSGKIGSQGSTPASTRQQSGRSGAAAGGESQRGPRGEGQRQGKFNPHHEDIDVSGMGEDLEEIEERDEDEDEETA